MKYKIRDGQFKERYFADEELFDDLEEIRQQLVDYHSVDYEGDEDIEDMSLRDILDYGEWSIEDENGNFVDIFARCWECGEPLGDPQLEHEGALYCDKCFDKPKTNS